MTAYRKDDQYRVRRGCALFWSAIKLTTRKSWPEIVVHIDRRMLELGTLALRSRHYGGRIQINRLSTLIGVLRFGDAVPGANRSFGNPVR